MGKPARLCRIEQCERKNAGGGFCIAHGGGKRCEVVNCTKIAQGGGFCRTHGGGSKCQQSDCQKFNAGGGFCRAHGGGKRCRKASCGKADVGGGYCTAHGGGKRCSVAECTKNDQGGGKCRAHGGGPRCRVKGCNKVSRGKNRSCIDHGGNPVCQVKRCRRVAKDESTFCCLHSNNVKTTPVLKATSPKIERLEYRKMVVQLEDAAGLSADTVTQLKHELLKAMQIDSLSLDPSNSQIVIIGLFQTTVLTSALLKSSRLSTSFRIVVDMPLSCPQKEVVLRVSDMMCMGNCGTTVSRALESVYGVHRVQMIFEQRLVIVTGTVQTSWLVGAVNSVGFNADVQSVLNIPMDLWLRLDTIDGVISHTASERLRQTCLARPDVEEVVWFPERQALMIRGYATEETMVALVVAQGFLASKLDKASKDSNYPCMPNATHACDESVCATSGCQLFLTRSSHAAALASGFVVPGCSMWFSGM